VSGGATVLVAAAYRSKIDGTLVVNAQAQVVVAGRSVPRLAEIAQSALD
jgi:hypothetical protein